MAEAAAAQAATETAKAEAAEARTAQQAAEKAQAAAEVARIAAEENADGQVALAETAKMAAQAALDAKDKADDALIVARDMQKAAEDERDLALAAEDTARQQLQEARAATTAEGLRRQQAEQARERAEMEREEAEQAANAAEAAIVHTGLGGTIAHSLSAMPQYRAAANLTEPDIEGTGAGSSGRWFRTSGSSQSGGTTQHVLLYSDVEAPDSVPFKDSTYNMDDDVVDAKGMVLEAGYVLGTDLRMDVASGSFDRTSTSAKSFDIGDRGEHTTAQERTEAITMAQSTFDGDPTDANRVALAAARASKVRDTNRHPYRWSAEAGGTLGGASGRFRCGSTGSNAETSCTVQNTGGGFVFDGPWFFVPSSGTVSVRVPDDEHMWFGWWSTETATTFVFDTNHGGTAQLTTLTGVTGTATYSGIAVGQYAISGTLVANQGHGEFTANARLTADFVENTVIGSITNISGQPDWEISLTGGEIGGAAVTGSSTSWTIGGDTQDLSTDVPWRANFYSNLPEEDDRANVQPYGIAGTFEASHGSAARMAGAFGAHR